MSITDELREWGNRWEDAVADEIDAIADRIEEQHRKALEKVAAMVDAPPKLDEKRFDALRDGFNIGRARGYDEGFKAHLADLEARIGAVERKLNHRGER